MSSSTLFRWSGLATLLAGVLLPLSWVLRFVFFDPSSPQIADNTLEFIATILLVFGIIGLYGFQIKETAIYGLLGFLLVTFSNCVSLGQIWLQDGPATGAAAVLGPLTGITLLPGFILLGIGSWIAARLPRWTAVLWIIGSALIVTGFAVQGMLVVIGGVVLGVGLAGAGLRLWLGQVEPARSGGAAR